MATLNPQLKTYNGTDYDIINPKTTASNIAVVASGQGGYSASRQFVTGEILSKLSSPNIANNFLTLDANGQVPANLLENALTELEATPYSGTADPVNGDLIVYKSGEIAYMPQSALAISTAMQTALNNKLNTSLKGQASGLAELDSNGKVPLTQINDSLIGQVEYMGTWNASTNSPILPATPTEKGQYYITSVAGTQFSKSFEVGDWIIASGTTGSLYWDKVDNTDAVSSVNAKTGVVVLDASDVGARASNWVPSYADLTGTKPTYTASEVGARPNTWVPSYADLTGTKPTYTASEVGARPNTWVPSYSDITGTKPPSGAQVNIIEAVQVNGTDLTITSKKVDVTRTLVGANKTFIGSTTPTGAIEGDLWIDTSA